MYTGGVTIKEFDNLIIQCNNMAKSRKDINMVDEYLITRGFNKSRDTNAYVQFYNSACINESTWSKFYAGTSEQKSTSKKTLFKILLALRMPLDDAMLFLQYAGYAFSVRDKRDMLIYVYIKNDYLHKTEIDDIITDINNLIEYYSEKEISAHRKGLEKLFDI